MLILFHEWEKFQATQYSCSTNNGEKMTITFSTRSFEKRFIRPLVHRCKAFLHIGKPHQGNLTDSDLRIIALEKRVKQLESLVREDLGLRYLGLSRDDNSFHRTN